MPASTELELAVLVTVRTGTLCSRGLLEGIRGGKTSPNLMSETACAGVARSRSVADLVAFNLVTLPAARVDAVWVNPMKPTSKPSNRLAITTNLNNL